MERRPPGKIITFYSYKGGTGRSMALANVAWILASAGQRVLAVDWDLEAPGLHRYFMPFLLDKDLTETEGIIDFVISYVTEALTPEKQGRTPPPDWYKAHSDIVRYAASLEWAFPGRGSLDFIGAGRQGSTYSSKVNTFDWQRFYEKLGGGAVLEEAKQRMKQEYDYILVDSRTGVSDTSGICTVQLPDLVVVCFTMNNQSIHGVARVVAAIQEQRSTNPVVILPVPMRVDGFEKDKLDLRRSKARAMFALLPDGMSPSEREAYWGRIEFWYSPWYAYEEVLSVFRDTPDDTKSFLAYAQTLTGYLSGGSVARLAAIPPPEIRKQILDQYAGSVVESVPSSDLNRVAEEAFAGLSGEQAETARRLFLRLVRVASPSEGIGDTVVRAPLDALNPSEGQVARAFTAAEILMIDTSGKESAVQIGDPALIIQWKRLHDWLDAERDFLLWRQKLRANIADWEKTNRKRGALLTGEALRVAKPWRNQRRGDLSQQELDYIQASLAARRNEVLVRGTVAVLVLGIIGSQILKQIRSNRTASAIAAVARADSLISRRANDSALAQYTRALELKPDYAEAYVKRGLAYFGRGDTQRALADYDRALQIQDTLAFAYFSRGLIYMRQDSNAKAIDDLSRGLNIDSTYAQALIWRGDLYDAQGSPDLALADYSQAIRLQPNNTGAYLARGVIYARKGLRDSAAADYNKALQTFTDPQDSVLAAARLRQLGIRPESTAVAAGTRVYLHYADERDEPTLLRLRKSLASKGMRIEGAERRPERTNGDVRYFYLEDQRQATAVGSAVEYSLAEQGIGLKLQVLYRDARLFPNARRGDIEVWLPLLTRTPSQQAN